MTTLILLYLVLGTIYKMYSESKGIAEGSVTVDSMVDFNSRLISWLIWPVDIFKGDD